MVQCTVYRTRAFTSMSSQDLHNNPVELGTEIISSVGGGRREGPSQARGGRVPV